MFTNNRLYFVAHDICKITGLSISNIDEKYNEYDVFKIEPKIPHNIYMYPNAVLHTVKYGKVREYDWEPFEKLDEILNSKPIEEIEKSYIIK